MKYLKCTYDEWDEAEKKAKQKKKPRKNPSWKSAKVHKNINAR